MQLLPTVTRCWTFALAFALIAGWVTLDVRAQGRAGQGREGRGRGVQVDLPRVPVAEAHVAAAKAAEVPKTPDPEHLHTFDALFNLICRQPNPAARQPAVGPGESDELAKTKATPRDEWYVPPAKVFDNLFYIGTKNESTWALTTSAGIILLNTNFDWVMPELLNELKTFNLNPADIKYVVVLRSHSDQAWGINPVKKIVPGARVIMAAGEWDLLAKDNTPAYLKPTRDMVATDGYKLTLGDTTVTLYQTPTSTPTNLSAIISPLKDGNRRHVGGMIGGDFMRLVQEGIQMFPDMKAMSQTYIASSKRFKEIEEKAGVDAIIHTHAEYDNTFEKIAALKNRPAGAPHPFVSKDDVERFNMMHVACGEAQLAWASAR
jgi:metallo-beta-lactamase class B